MTRSKLSARDICALSLMGALMIGSKLALVSLPNIHLNAVLIIITSIFFGWKAMYSVAVYVMMEGLIFGFALWWICYLYAWPLLCAVCVLMRKNDDALIWAVVAGIHGLIFGALCSIPFLFIGGWSLAFSYWVSGITFDLIHCAGNFTLTLVLYRPLKNAASAVLKRTTA